MTVILDFYKEMCQSACKTRSDLMWGKPVPCLGIRLRNSFSFCLCELRTFFTMVNCQLEKLKWKFSVGCGENLHQHYHSGENGKLAPKPSVSLSSTVQWCWRITSVLILVYLAYSLPLTLIFLYCSQIRTLPTLLRYLESLPQCYTVRRETYSTEMKSEVKLQLR